MNFTVVSWFQRPSSLPEAMRFLRLTRVWAETEKADQFVIWSEEILDVRVELGQVKVILGVCHPCVRRPDCPLPSVRPFNLSRWKQCERRENAATVVRDMLSELRETVAELAEVKEPRGIERGRQERVGGGDRKTVERGPRARRGRVKVREAVAGGCKKA
jgi:hypothetical protein